MDKPELWKPYLEGIIGEGSPDDQIYAVVQLLMNYGMLEDARQLFPRIKDPQAFYAWYAPQLLGRNILDEAEHVIGRIEEPGLRNWLTADLHYRRQAWQDCLTLLAEIAEHDAGRAVDALWRTGDIYLNRTGQFKEAAKTYELIGLPPNSSFHAAIAYEKMGEFKKAAETLLEIERHFVDSAAEAAHRRGHMWEGAGELELAIKDYRAILKAYKGTQQASHAHEDLERLGVPTGGGELNTP
jgi:tetratricopeptide (TPR) repeat protein